MMLMSVMLVMVMTRGLFVLLLGDPSLYQRSVMLYSGIDM